MSRFFLTMALITALGCGALLSVRAQTPSATPEAPATAPAAPPLEVPPLNPDSPETFIIVIDRSAAHASLQNKSQKKVEVARPPVDALVFDPESHRRANAMSLVNKEYAGQLSQALYGQDSLHQLESKAHFDNCAFVLSLDYIDELLRELNGSVQQAQKHEAAGNPLRMKVHLKFAFYKLGQVLHNVQDFYAHSNYVELMRGQYGSLSDVPVIPVWTDIGRAHVEALADNGLFSGVVFWGFPKQCPPGVPSHGSLAKDSAEDDASRVIVGQWGVTQYGAALKLATRASREFVIYAFNRWPLLMRVGGDAVAFDIFQERRKF